MNQSENGGPSGQMIVSYTRAQAIADGQLIDVTKTAKEAGWTFPVAVTASVWGRCVAIPEGVIGQDEQGRLWDVVYMGALGVRANRGTPTSRMSFRVCVRNDNRSRRNGPPAVALVAVVGPGDNGEPVVTIMEPGED